VLIRYQSAEEVAQGVDLTPGARRLWTLLHALAVDVARARGHGAAPDTLTYHCPAVIVAAAVGYTERHARTLAAELRAAGLLDSRAHVGNVGRLRRHTGTLYAVALRPGVRPRLRFWDFRHDWRPTFADDYHGESGAWREVQAITSQPLTLEGKQGRLRALAQTWAAGTRTPKAPLEGGWEVRQSAGFSAIAARVQALAALHPRQRHREVSALAADLAHALDEPHRRRQWAGALYRAVDEEFQQRPALAYFAAQVARLAADLAEGAPWVRPGAILAARLRPA
jgi:hypothetical protein